MPYFRPNFFNAWMFCFRILSVRELRTMLAMFSELPIDMDDVRGFEDLLRSCDKEYNGTRPSIAPIEYDTHYDPDLVSEREREGLTVITFLPTRFSLSLIHKQPLVTLDFTLHCQPLVEKINKTVTSQKKYKWVTHFNSWSSCFIVWCNVTSSGLRRHLMML